MHKIQNVKVNCLYVYLSSTRQELMINNPNHIKLLKDGWCNQSVHLQLQCHPYNDEFHNVIKKMIMMFFIYIVRFIIMKGTHIMPTRGLFVGVRCLLMFLTEIIINVDNEVPFKYKLERNFIECFMISFWFIKVFLCLLQMKARNGWFGTSTNWEFHDPFTMRIWNTARLYIPCQNLASTKSLFNSSFSSIYKNYLSQNFKSFQPNQKLSFWLHLGFEVFRCTKLAITNWSGDKGWISESRYTERNTDGSTGTEDFQDFWTRVKYGPCDHKIFKSCGVVLGVEELENQMNMQRDY